MSVDFDKRYWDRVQAAIGEANRFITAANEAQLHHGSPSVQNAAMLRASLDLTRALALVRRGRYGD